MTLRTIPLLALALASCAEEITCGIGADEEPTVWFIDQDSDGFGSPSDPFVSCEPQRGRVNNGLDCDDERSEVYPGAGPDICDTIDQDCDGSVDEDGAVALYLDQDNDGFGTGEALVTCLVIPGYIEVDGDCDDSEATAYPGAEELCDAIDNDCNGTADEVIRATCYTDADDDGFGSPATARPSCEATCGAGSTEVGGDCIDDDPEVFPGAIENCDGLDNDCDPATPIDVGAECIDDSIVFEDATTGSVYILSFGPLRHSTASSLCGGRGYHLVWIDNQAEADFLLSFAAAYTNSETIWTGVRWNGCAATDTFSRVDDGSNPLFCGPLAGWETAAVAGLSGPGVATLGPSGLAVEPNLSTTNPALCELDP